MADGLMAAARKPAGRKPTPPTGGSKRPTSRAAAVADNKFWADAKREKMRKSVVRGMAGPSGAKQIDTRFTGQAPPGAASSRFAAGGKEMLGDKRSPNKKAVDKRAVAKRAAAKKSGRTPAYNTYPDGPSQKAASVRSGARPRGPLVSKKTPVGRKARDAMSR